jgi:hypothetical protein
MSTIKSSAENLTLNADGANNDIKFQSNGSEVASIDQAGLLTTAAVNVTGTVDNTISGTLVVKGGLSANQTSALTLFQQNSTHSTIKAFGADGSTTGILNTYVAASDGSPDTLVTSVTADGLTFFGDTAAANALSDYEEGTWTPAYTSGSSGYSSQQGKYTKIGEQVTAWFKLDMNNNQVGGSVLQIGGLPFTSSSHPSYGASSGLHCNAWSTSAKKPDNGLVAPNGTNIDLYHSQGTTGTTQPLGTDIGTGSLIGCVVYRTSS